jgi:NAD(P)-dependent dehydrogenase (short-subunit alcohol dehydrogenase family)
MKPLEGKVALVTGAGRGLGRACAEELARVGANVAINYATSREAAESLAGQLSANGARAIAVQADVRSYDQCKQMVERALEEFGRIDILVNNSGVNRDRTIRRMSVEEWEDVIQTDLTSAFYCTSLVVPGMVERKYGRIVNMSSIIGQMGNVGQSNYAAAKAGLIAMSKSLAQELARFNVTVNAMCPGFVETDMLAGVPDEPRQVLLSRIPMGRFGRPEEVAAFVRFLVVEGDWITGQQFNINGGMYM